MLPRALGLIFWGSLCIVKEGKGIFVPGNLLKFCGKTQALLFIGTFALLYKAAWEQGDQNPLSGSSRASPPLPTSGELTEEPAEAHEHFSGERQTSAMRDQGTLFNQ